jgi:hypothetical protein
MAQSHFTDTTGSRLTHNLAIWREQERQPVVHEWNDAKAEIPGDACTSCLKSR